MSEIAKLKARLKNIGRNTTEYRMTVAEAQALIEEIEDLSKKTSPAPVAAPAISPVTIIQVLDGGSF